MKNKKITIAEKETNIIDNNNSETTENKKKRYERRLHILRALITNAMNIVSIDFVSALNMILVEYKSNSEVRKRHESFIEWACSPLPSNSDEAVLYNKKFDEILVRLIEEVAKSINIKIEQLDIANKIYWPKGFGYAAEKQQKLMELLINLTVAIRMKYL